MKFLDGLPLFAPVDVHEHRLHVLGDGGEVFISDVLAELEQVEILESDCLRFLGEIVDGDGQHVELKFPLEQRLDLVAVDLLAE